jgi:hypothetical protein
MLASRCGSVISLVALCEVRREEFSIKVNCQPCSLCRSGLSEHDSLQNGQNGREGVSWLEQQHKKKSALNFKTISVDPRINYMTMTMQGEELGDSRGAGDASE